MRLNVIAISIGLVSAIVGIAVIEVLVWEIILDTLTLPESFQEFAYSNAGDVLFASIGLFLGSMLGGYATGRTAKMNAMFNGFAMGFFSVAIIAVLASFEASTYAYLGINYTFSLDEGVLFFIDSMTSISGAMIGAHLSQRKML